MPHVTWNTALTSLSKHGKHLTQMYPTKTPWTPWTGQVNTLPWKEKGAGLLKHFKYNSLQSVSLFDRYCFLIHTFTLIHILRHNHYLGNKGKKKQITFFKKHFTW